MTASPSPSARGDGPRATYDQVQASAEFARLRRRSRRFVFPLTGLFLAWYFLYVALAAFAPSLMATPVSGNLDVGLVLGLLQFASTFAIATIYARWAHRELDPAAACLRDRLEPGGG